MRSLAKKAIAIDNFDYDALLGKLCCGALMLLNKLKQNKVCYEIFQYIKEEIKTLALIKDYVRIYSVFKPSITI